MNILTMQNEFKPSEIAKILTDEYGFKLTPAAIRKWDKEIYSKISGIVNRSYGEFRKYDKKDLENFTLIGLLRCLDYSSESIVQIIKNKQDKNVVNEILISIEKHMNAFEYFKKGVKNG